MSLSTTASPTPPPSTPREPNAFDSVAALVESRIGEAQKALWWAELIRSLLRILIGAVVAVLVWVVVDQWLYSPGRGARIVGFIALLSWVVSQTLLRVVPVLRGAIRPEYAAYSLERDVPEMRQELTSYVTLRDQKDAPGLRGKVIRSIGAHAASRLRTHDALPIEATGMIRWWLVTAGLMAIFFLYAALSPKDSFQSASRLVMPIASIDPAKRVMIRDVLPGNVETLAGRTLEISAVVEGLRQDEPVICRWQAQDREVETPLQRDASSGRYLGEITLEHASSGQVPYQIEAGDNLAGPFYLTVQDVPVVAVQSIRYVPPSYTQKQPHTSSSAAITALDGTQVTVSARTNRPIEKATIQFNPKPLGDTVHATAGSMEMQVDESGTLITFSFPVRYARERSSAVQLESYRIKVWDKSGQTNPAPIVYPIRVIADLSPEVTIVMPQQSPKSIPIDAQQIIEIHAADADYGLQRIELEIRRGIEVLERATLWKDDVGRKGNQIAEYRFRPHEHFLRVGDAVQVTAIATDNRGDVMDPLVEPNVAKTDPVELRITMSEPVPKEPVAGEGLSAPDKKPAASPDAGESAGQGEQGGASGGASQSGGKSKSGEQSGGSSGGTGGESGEQQDSDPENQSGSSGGSGTQPPSDAEDSQGEGDNKDASGGGASSGASQDSGESRDDSGGEMKDSQPGDSQPSDSKSGNSQPGDSKQGDSPQGDSKPNDAKSGDAKSSDAKSSDAKSGDAKSGEDGAGGNSAGAGQDGGDPSGGAKPKGRENSNSKQTDSATGSKQGESGPNETGQGETGQGGAEQGMSDPSQSTDGSQQGSEQGQGSEQNQSGSAEREPPKHDGEAFERIRDYLDQKKQQQSGQGSQGDSAAKPDSNSDAGSERQSSADANDPNQMNESGSGEDSTADATNSAKQSTGQDAQNNKPAGAESGAGKSGEEQPQTPPSSKPADSKQGDTEKSGDGSGEKSGEGAAKDGAAKDETSPQGDAKANEQGSQNDAENGSSSDSMNPQDGGEQGAGKQGAGKQGAGNEGAANSSDTSDASASPQGNKDANQAAPDASESQDQANQDQANQDQANQDQANQGEAKSRDEAKSKGSDPQSGQPRDSASEPTPSSESGEPRRQAPDGSGAGSNGSGSGADSGNAVDSLPPTSDPVDLDYAKKSTDMVLDYLNETRDKPDQDLLEKLNWTDADLQRFAERWKQVRELDQTGASDPSKQQELREALESLGMRPPTQATSQRREQADALRGLRDAGNRTPPPAAYQDAFDSFRRAIGGK
ncbi:hypothetical protein Pla52o_45210 [Novipirellula galeiformis]|uniref:Uncharacterized protein n=1 Tax=Novipirellula galeiformis TaxID=2528004 RepID=A0A5C6C7M0_9BACT|nr:hypothetical protein [Novipirellula galeiformis]TWU20643.1 hypothetical protein Pla52o_45210 [Novipirellula galeiformis]